MNTKYFPKHIPFFFISICIFFYVLNIFTPLYCDDWHYNFIFGTTEPIDSLLDILKSQWTHYNQFNGRFTPHFFIQLFDGILGKHLFNIINTLFFALFIILLSYQIGKTGEQRRRLLSYIILILFLFLPGFKKNLLWMSGACNYLWVAVFILIFHLFLQKNITKKRYYLPLAVFGFFCGWTNEALIVGLAFGYFVYYLFHKKLLTSSRICLLCGFYFGSFLLVFSPGSIQRALSDTPSTESYIFLLKKILILLSKMDNLRITFLLISLLVISQLVKKITLKEFFSENIIWFCALVITFIFVLLTGHVSHHSRFGIEFFSLVLLLKLLLLYNVPSFFFRISDVVCICLSLFILHFARLNFKDSMDCLNQIQNTDQEIILNNSVKCNSYVNRFVLRNPDPGYEFLDYKWIAKHFSKKSIIFIPKGLYNDIQNNFNKYSSFDLNSPFPFYVKRISQELEISTVRFELNESILRDIPMLIRPFIKKEHRYTDNYVEASLYSIIELDNNRYLFVKKDKGIDTKVKNILVN